MRCNPVKSLLPLVVAVGHERGRTDGFSLIELAFVLGLAATIAATSIAQVSMSLAHVRAVGAARYVAARLQRTRTDAVARNRHVALRIVSAGNDYTLATYVDGNGDGVLSRDVQTGVDPMTIRPERVGDHFPGVRFGTLPNLPPIDASTTAPGADPVRLGAGNMAVFTPLGTASSGTVYLLGDADLQLAVRIFGETGRTRVLQFDRRGRRWTPLSGR